MNLEIYKIQNAKCEKMKEYDTCTILSALRVNTCIVSRASYIPYRTFDTTK